MICLGSIIFRPCYQRCLRDEVPRLCSILCHRSFLTYNCCYITMNKQSHSYSLHYQNMSHYAQIWSACDRGVGSQLRWGRAQSWSIVSSLSAGPCAQHCAPQWNIFIIGWITIEKWIQTIMVPRGWILTNLVILRFFHLCSGSVHDKMLMIKFSLAFGLLWD